MPVLADFFAAQPAVAEPDEAGPLAVFPVIAQAAPRLGYLPFAQARAHGAAVKELEQGASVNDLLVINPLDVPVLLYEGEEVLGAQQNRTFDVSVLVAPRSRLRVPVSCVEAGRWDGSRHSEDFAPAPQAAYPELRRRKSERMRQAMAAGAEARASQSEVWDEVAAKSLRLGVDSPSGAMHDMFERRRADLERMRSAVEMKCSQIGALVAIGGRFVVLDLVSQPDAFEVLLGPLVQGYALDALEAEADAPVPAPSLEDARDFLALLLDAPVAGAQVPGMGFGVRYEFGGMGGTALLHGGEAVTLTAYAAGLTTRSA